MVRLVVIIFALFAAAWQCVAALPNSNPPIEDRDISKLTNAQRLRERLPLKKPARRSSTRTLVPRADTSQGTGQTGVISVTPYDPVGRKRAATAGYLEFDASANRFRVTPNLNEATLVSAFSSGSASATQITVYTSAGSYNLGHITTTQSVPDIARDVVATSFSDGGAPSGQTEQTTVWTYGAFSQGSPGALMAKYYPAAPNAAVTLYFRIVNNFLVGSNTEPGSSSDNPVKLALVFSSSSPATTSAGPTLSPSTADPNVDPNLTNVDNNENAGGVTDQEIACTACLLDGGSAESCQPVCGA